ncbi:MAG: alpha/beta hydrolase [Pirellulales bacterium]
MLSHCRPPTRFLAATLGFFLSCLWVMIAAENVMHADPTTDDTAHPAAGTATAEGLGTHGYVDSGGVRLHYVTAGNGPLVVLLHGFPDYWYTWRAQMPALAKHFQVVALDMRGYNHSDQPEGVENYSVDRLTADVAAVIAHFGRKSAIVVGHDWGGYVAWTLAMTRPELVDRLVILNLPHPRGLLRELTHNSDQQKASAYARAFQKPDAAASVQPEQLAFWVSDPAAREKYIVAMRRSSIEGMLNYYKANYPREPYDDAAAQNLPKVRCPVLMFHGLDDTALLPAGLNGTWDWLDEDLTLVTIPGAGHFVQQDAADKVTRHMLSWLQDPTP